VQICVQLNGGDTCRCLQQDCSIMLKICIKIVMKKDCVYGIDMIYDPKCPYNSLPLLPPKADLETKRILKACIASRAALAELKQVVNLLPNPAILINTIPLLEAQASSEIENVVTTTDRLFRYVEHESRADPATKEALRYRTALFQGYQELQHRPLNNNMAIRICQTLRGIDLDVRATPGTKLINELDGSVIYTPPEGKDLLRRLLQNLDGYLHAEDGVDPLIKMAVMHYQFEAIHPFTDGNGRTGRILNILYLLEVGLLNLPCLYLSGYIIKHKKSYYELLQRVSSQGDWENWILYMVEAIEKTAIWTVQQVGSIMNAFESMTEQVRKVAPEIYSRELIETLFTQPYCRIANVVDAGIAKRQTASKYLSRLVELGILKEFTDWKEKLFLNLPLLSVLTNNDAGRFS